jgi:hypothetical protein
VLHTLRVGSVLPVSQIPSTFHAGAMEVGRGRPDNGSVKRLWTLRIGTAALVACLGFGIAGCGSTKVITKTVTVHAASTSANALAPPSELTEFGHIAKLQRRGAGYLLRFDPAWFLSGVTANVAAAEDGAVPPGQPVPNDNYRLDEGHRLLSYLVPADAHVTVLTSNPLRQTPITVAELARIINGGKHRPLFEPLESGIWITYHIDTVSRIDQQYQP